MANNKLAQIVVGDIKPSPLNPRKHFAEADLAELTVSLLQDGVLQPLVVRPVADGDLGQPTGYSPADEADKKVPPAYELIAGERRWRAAQRAGLDTVPAIVRTDLDDVAVLRLMFVENVQRSQLRPIEEADACQAMLDADPKADMAALADLVGRSESWIYQRLQLQKLTANCRASVAAGRLSAGHAVEIARLEPPDQELALRQCDFAVREVPAPEWEKELSLRGLVQWIRHRIPISRRDPVKASKGIPIVLDHYLPNGAAVGKDEKKKILLKSAFALVRGRPCKHAVDGVVWFGDDAGAIQSVCPRQSRCKEHWGKYFAAQKEQQRREKAWKEKRARQDAAIAERDAERDRVEADLAPKLEAALREPPAFTPALARIAVQMLYAGLQWRIADNALEMAESAPEDDAWWPLLLRAALHCDGCWSLVALAKRAVDLHLLDPIEAHSVDLAGESDRGAAEDAEPRADVCTAGDGA